MIKTGDVTIIACSRGYGRPMEPCSCGRPSRYLCDYPLKGSKKGLTCSRPLCDACAKLIKKTAQGSIYYCPVHQRMAERETKER